MLYSTGLAPVNVAVADFNGDGLPDLVTANVDAGTVSVLLGNGDGSFKQHVDYPAGGPTVRAVATGDFNGDGVPDLVTLNPNTGNVYVLLGNGDGSFGPPTPYFAGGIGASSVAVGDLNGDGIPDLVVPGGASNKRLTCPPGDIRSVWRSRTSLETASRILSRRIPAPR
jgi:hypothetical protein